MKKALVVASVASMIDLFNRDNIIILKDLNYEVHVSANFNYGNITSKERVNKFKKELKDNGVIVNDVPIPRKITSIKDIFVSYNLLKKDISNEGYDMIHCQSPIGGVLCRIAAIKARRCGTKVIYTAHGFHFYKGSSLVNWLVYYPIEKLCSFFTDIAITINSEDYKISKKMHASKNYCIPGIGIDNAKIENIKIDIKDYRQKFGIDDDDFVFISVGQLSKRKNHKVVIEALSKINDSKVKYIIVGLGELENYLKNIVKQKGLENRIIFTGYREDVIELLKMSDAFIFPSKQEGLPVSLMEAMSAGNIIVCSKIRGNVDLIEDKINGYVFELNSFQTLLNSMNSVIHNRKSKRMQDINKIKILKYDKKVVNSLMRRIYNEI